MDVLRMVAPRSLPGDTTVFPAYIPVPGFGVLPANAFLIRAAQPVLIDTGVMGLQDEFMPQLRAAIDLRELRWLWLTHTDPDHVGSLRQVLAEAPQARLVTTFVGMAKMDLLGFPLDRAYLLNPGQRLNVGDRQLLAVKPATYDAPETTALFDEKTHTLYSADSFGALLPQPADDAAAIAPETLRDGVITWATVDSPWLPNVDERRLARILADIRALEPDWVLSYHLPPARGMIDTLVGYVEAARTAPPFIAPDQAGLERMMAAGAGA